MLDPVYREALLGAVAGTWLPASVALAHYAACDALGLSVDAEVANGRRTFERAGGSIFGTVGKLAKGAGVTPWTLFVHFQRFWSRSYDGGAVGVLKTGPKEALVQVVHAPPFESRYFRNAVRGLVVAGVELFCTKAYMTERPGARKRDAVAYRIQWA